MKNAGQMHRPDLEVNVLRIAPSRIDGRVAGDATGSALVPAGMDVTIFLNPPHTAFTDPDIAGQGRIYEDRLEVDLILPEGRAAVLCEALAQEGRLLFQTRPITESLFRIEAVGTA